jgi:hypothetical protein
MFYLVKIQVGYGRGPEMNSTLSAKASSPAAKLNPATEMDEEDASVG